VFLYRKGGKATELGLRSTNDASIVEAHQGGRAELRGALATGGDPRAHRERERKRQAQALEDAGAITLEVAARRYHERHKAKWHSGQYAKQWLRGLELHAFPGIGRLSVGRVDMAATLSVIEPMWYTKPRVAQMVRANVESVLDLARAEGQRTTDNPARWELLKHSLPARKGARTAGHFRALTYGDMPALLKDLEKQDVISALCMRFTILTVALTKEATACPVDGHRPSGPHEKGAVKGGEAWQHMVPLSEQAIDLLRGLVLEGKRPKIPARRGR
jgi:hypothetical protein